MSGQRARLVFAVLLAVLVVGFVAKAFFGAGQEQGAPIVPAPSPAPVVTSAPRLATTAPDGSRYGGALAGAQAWWHAACRLSPGLWGESVHALMTEPAWLYANHTPPIITASWTCADEKVRMEANGPVAIAVFSALRTITAPGARPATEVAKERRVMVYENEEWLVGPPPVAD